MKTYAIYNIETSKYYGGVEERDTFEGAFSSYLGSTLNQLIYLNADINFHPPSEITLIEYLINIDNTKYELRCLESEGGKTKWCEKQLSLEEIRNILYQIKDLKKLIY